MEEILKKLKEHDEQLDLIARAVAEHTEHFNRIEDKLGQVSTKDDISKMMNTLDKIAGFAKKKDEELALLASGLKQTETRIGAVERDIKQMKPAFGIS